MAPRRVGSACHAVRPPARARRAAGDRPQDRPGQGRAAGPGDRHDRRVPAGPLRAVPRRRPARPRASPRSTAAAGAGILGPHDRDRRGREVLEHRRADAAAHPPADRAGADRRAARSRSSSTCAAIADRRACGPASASPSRRPAATSWACAPRRCATATTGSSPARSAGCRASCRPTGTACSPRPARPTRAQHDRHLVLRRRALAGPACQVGRTDDKMGVRGVDTGELLLDDVRVPGRERRRRGRRVPARDARPQLDAADRRGARHRPRRGRAHVRGRVREGARRVRQDDRRHAGHPVEDRRARHRDRGGPPAHLPVGVDGRPRASSPRSTCRTSRWRSTTRPRWR